jgi:hypothetical protein
MIAMMKNVTAHLNIGVSFLRNMVLPIHVEYVKNRGAPMGYNPTATWKCSGAD